MAQRFEYHAPDTLDGALVLLQELGDSAHVLAGGTVLLKEIREGNLFPSDVVNIKRIGELGRLVAGDDGLHIGALVSVTDLMRFPAVREDYPLLAEAAATMGAVQMRNLATVGGNLCNASPAADLGPPLIALDARAEIAGPAGRRTLPVADLFAGPGKPALAHGEILVGVWVPRPIPELRTRFLKMAPRGAMEIAVASVTVALRADDSHFEQVKIVMGAVGPTPLRARKAEDSLQGQPFEASAIEQASQLAAEETQPIDDLRASAWYRRAVVKSLTRRALSSLTGESV